MDIFGPYMITDDTSTRRNSSTKKMWAVIFTCLVTRATHLEALPMMDTSSFVNALRRFFAIRGMCHHLRSDQGSNLVGAYNQSATLSLTVIEKDIRNLNCTWSLNPPKASHHGGVWERKIGCIKSIINACLLKISPRNPTRDELCTFFQEAASILNNTPLCTVAADPNEPLPITPAMLLTCKTEPNPSPPETFTTSDILAYGTRRWRRVKVLCDEFFKRCRQEYIHNLTARQKWTLKRRNVKVGDVVLLKNEGLKRTIGLFVELKKSIGAKMVS